jgi:hypothetical protein
MTIDTSNDESMVADTTNDINTQQDMPRDGHHSEK